MKENKSYQLFIEFVKSVFTSLIFVLILTNFVVKPIKVNGDSMFPSLKDQSLGFSNILTYSLFGVNRYDIVIVYVESMNEFLVKRVIGLPNETIEVKDDQVYINGELINQDFLDEEYVSQFPIFTNGFEKVTIGDDEVFLMGDNRPYSSDSRVFGTFKLEDIIAKDAYIFYPLNEINWFKGD